MWTIIPGAAELDEPRLLLEPIGTGQEPTPVIFTMHVWNSPLPSVVKVGRRLGPSERRKARSN